MTPIRKKLLIIGAGPAGYTAALRAAHYGIDTALIDNHQPGGVCLNRGCIPTKTLLESTSLAAAVNSGVFGLQGKISADLTAIFQRKEQIVQKLSSGITSLLKARGVTLFCSSARFTGSKTVTLTDGQIIEAENILLALGAEPALPSIPGIELAKTSDDILSCNFEKYQQISIIGAGVIGIELATFFSQLGSKVTLLEGLPTILPSFPSDTVKYIGMALRRSGIKTILNTKVQSISQQENGNLLVYYEEKCKSAALDSELVIVCTGRRPRSIEGLEEYCGIHFDRGIPTNEQGETSSPGIYAAGDCVRGSIQLAHYASARAVAIINSLAGKPVHTNFDSVPSCIYTIPPAAKAGLSEKEALDSGHQIQIGKFNLGANGKSLISAEERGFVKVIFDSENEQLLGIELVAAQAPEMVGMLSILIAMKAKRSDLLRGIFPHPSVSEGIMEAIEDSQKQAIHVLYR